MKITNAAELREAKQKRGQLFQQLKDLNKEAMTPDEQRSWDDVKAQFDEVDGAITAYESQATRQAVLDGIQQRAAQPFPAEPAQVRQAQGLHLFGNLGEQLRAVYDAAVNHRMDERLQQLNTESRAQGASEGVGADGGFAVQTDFAGQMFDSAVESGAILSRVDTYEVSANSNAAQWVAIDEDDTSAAYGGVQVYWAAEGNSVTKSAPKLREVKMDLKKLMGIAYATEELMQDTNFMSQLYQRAFTTAINYELEADILDGSGVGRPLGILKSGALVTVAKEAAQTADTVVYENILHMWGTLTPRSRSNSVWMMHPDAEEILPFMHLPVGDGGVPVYLPPTGISGNGYATLFGRPVLPTEHCSALGDLGDVVLADLMQYQLIRKGGVQTAQSIHVQFLTAEQCFRFIFRANGQPKIDKALTIKNSTKKRSPFVTLAAR